MTLRQKHYLVVSYHIVKPEIEKERFFRGFTMPVSLC